ncbi:NAD(P)-binding protein [bacterium]|nr:NAD(P)-binding protein [bacterium]
MTSKKKPKIAMVGAGACSTFLSQMLTPYFQIDCFEKSRGIGGRAAYRRYSDTNFIHGAQAFRVRDQSFFQYLNPMIEGDLLYEWVPKLISYDEFGKTFKRLWYEKRYSHCHSIAHFLKDIACFDSLYTQAKINSIAVDNRDHVVLATDDEVFKGYSFCLITAPPVQAKQLLSLNTEQEPKIKKIQSQYVSMLSLTQDNRSQWEVAYGQNMFLEKIIRMKHEQNLSNNYVVFSEILDNPNDFDKNSLRPNAYDKMKLEFFNFLKSDEDQLEHEEHHYWRYRKTMMDTDQKFYCDKSEKIYICGDSFFESNDIQAAFLSAQAVVNDLKKKGVLLV